MVEVGKFGNKTIVIDGRYIHVFKAGELLKKVAYMLYLLPDGNLYKYRRTITIKERSGKDLTDYQVKIEIIGDDPIFAHARSAGEDIRFCYHLEEDMIPHWIEKFDPTNKEAIIWVKVPKIPANSEIKIYMYYGNLEVASASDGEATFVFFDDFEGKTRTTWYTTGSHNVFVASDYYYHGSYSLKKPSYSGWEAQYTYISIPNEFVMRFAFRTSNHDYENRIYLWNSDRSEYYFMLAPANYNRNDQSITYYSGGTEVTTGFGGEIPNNYWRVYEVFVYGNKIRAREIRDESGDTGWLSFDGIPQLDKYAFGFLSKPELEHWFDYWIIRKYTEPEPSVSVGVEEE